MASSRPREDASTQEQIGALVDERLLRYLSTNVPVVPFQPGMTLDAVAFEAGKQWVLALLRECQRHANTRNT